MELMLVGDAGLTRVLGWISAWILTYLVHSTLLLGGAYGAGRVIRSPAVREVLWKAAAVGALLTASASLVLQGSASPLLEMHELAQATGTSRVNSPGSASLPVSGTTVAGLWLVTALLGLYRMERGRRRYWRQVGRRSTLTDAAAVSTLRRLQDAAGCSRTIYLTSSDGIGAPAAIGTAEICLPPDSFAALSPVQRESVLAHELGHLVRRDPLWRFAVELLAALLLVQPLLRLARRELRECAEMLCDDFAVGLTGHRRPLVESLTILAGSLRPDHAAATALVGGDSPLVRRAARLLDGSRSPVAPRGRAAAGALSASLLLATTALAPAVAPPEPGSPAEREFLKVVTVEADSIRAPASLEQARGGLVLTEQEGAFRRELTVRRAADGTVRREYSENGIVVEPDANARRWIAEVLRRHEVR